jgi:hypothetical protein
LSSTNATVPSSWKEVNAGVSVQVTGVSCLLKLRCVAVDNNGDVLTSSNPTGGGSAWSVTRLIPYVQPPGEHEEPLNGLFGASCSSSSFCALVGADGRIFTSTDPFAAPSQPFGDPSGRKRRHRKRPKVTIARLLLPSARALRAHRGQVVVRFFADAPVRRFECRVNHRRFRPCRSPKRIRVAQKGTYAIRVRAVGKTGLRGPVAVERFWTGKRCKHHQCFAPAGVLPLTARR